MKKFSLILCVLLLCTSCTAIAQRNVIQEINSKIKIIEHFSFISLVDGERAVFGGVAMKNSDCLESNIGIYLKSKFPFIIDNSWKSISYELYDFKNRQIKEIKFPNNGKPAYRKVERLIEKPHDLYNKYSWENSPRGIAIQSKYVKLSFGKKVAIKNQKWEFHSGQYDLSNTKEKMPGSLQGYLYLWYAADKQSVVELYTDASKKPVVIRKLYLDNKELFKDQPRDNPESLVKMFMTLYEEAKFDEFVAAVKN